MCSVGCQKSIFLLFQIFLPLYRTAKWGSWPYEDINVFLAYVPFILTQILTIGVIFLLRRQLMHYQRSSTEFNVQLQQTDIEARHTDLNQQTSHDLSSGNEVYHFIQFKSHNIA